MFSRSDETAPGHYAPSQTALLLIDYHKLITGMVGAKGEATVEAATRMRTWARALGVQVIHALIDTNATPFPHCKDVGIFTHVVERLRSAEEGAEPAQLRDGAGDVTFVRRPGHVSALKSPGLAEFLEGKGIRSLIIMGLSTSGCVLRTAAAATDCEYVVTVIEDGCADRDERVHEVLMESVLSNRAYVANSTEFKDGYADRV